MYIISLGLILRRLQRLVIPAKAGMTTMDGGNAIGLSGTILAQ